MIVLPLRSALAFSSLWHTSTLPPFEFYEETVDAFADWVRSARKTETRNAGRDLDSLFVRSDGSAPSKDFSLDRGDRLLTIQIMNWEPGMSDQSMTMRRVPGGWLRGPRAEMKN